jgi:diguanylate cyclase
MGFFSKSADKNIDDEKDKWRDKYLNLLDAQELSEKVHKEVQELLGKTIVRLTIAASGVDQQLEPHLKRIRTHLKNDINVHQLKAELENLTSAINQLDDVSSDGQHTDTDISLLFAFLRQRYTSVKQQQDLNLLKESCKFMDDPQRLFSAIVDIIEEDSTGNISAVQCKETTPLFQQIAPFFVNKQLLQLLEHIEIPDAFIPKAQALKQQLATQEATLSHESILDSVISLLIEINDNSQPKQHDIDKFLAHITEQLTELGLAITGSGAALMDASLNRSKLDQSVSEQMSDLQHRSIHATQLEPLKEVISSRIAEITQEIQEHKQKEAIQRENYQHQLEELSQKINAMESETGELKSKLITANTHALRDALTDLPNRQAYDERLITEISRWQRYHTPLCLVVWDIDFFKNINDQFGHQIGDKVLVHVACQFSKHIRKSDFIARFGGEEFSMLLPHTNKHSAFKVAEKFRSLIEQSHLNVNDTPLSITISCGITQFIKGDTHEVAFARADQALYRAKEQGRNQCCMG